MSARLDDQFDDYSLLDLWADKVRKKIQKPKTIAFTLSGVAAVGFIFSNALFFQQGQHPGVLFKTRDIENNYSLRADELGIGTAETIDDKAKSVTRIVLNANSNRGIENALPQKVVTRPVTSSTPINSQSNGASSANGEFAQLQQLLLQLGFYDGSVDGLSGPKTKAAIEAYKVNVGLRGIELTTAELLTSARNNLIVTAAIPSKRPTTSQEIPSQKVETVRYTPPTTPRPEQSPARSVDSNILKVQAGLRAFGNKTVGVDGKMGPQTVNAIKEFQNLFKLPATGAVDNELIRKMSDVGLIN
ncbi:MAG: peptidoglycan-binding domain-containing protein [Ahrensia sp.]|nr:peptidoglycan-binding domain-containing protein [Ahrensia sp.]